MEYICGKHKIDLVEEVDVYSQVHLVCIKCIEELEEINKDGNDRK